MENRQFVGFDVGLPGTGLAIWHINTSKTTTSHIDANDVNADENLKGVDLEEADGNLDLDNNTNRGDDGDLYPGSSCNLSFEDNTTPNSQTYSPIDNTNKPVTNIIESGNTVRFDYMGYNPISGPSLRCSSGATFTLNNLPSVDSIIWETGPFLTVYSGQNTDSPVIKATGNSRSWVQVRLVNDCGSITLPRQTVWAGTPLPIILLCPVNDNYPGSVGPAVDFGFAGEDYWLYAYGTDLSGNDADYLWKFYPSDPLQLPVQGTGRQIEFSKDTPGNYTVSLQYNGVCGWTREIFKNIRIEYDLRSKNYLSISPNPTTGETTLTIEAGTETESLNSASVGEGTFDDNAEWDVEIYSPMQALKTKKTKLKGKSTTIQTSGWKEGIYMVRVKYKDEILTGKLIVKR